MSELDQVKQLTPKEVKVALLNLVKDGKIWAHCPKCSIVISFKELKTKKCDTCGKIDDEKVTFTAKNAENVC